MLTKLKITKGGAHQIETQVQGQAWAQVSQGLEGRLMGRIQWPVDIQTWRPTGGQIYWALRQELV